MTSRVWPESLTLVAQTHLKKDALRSHAIDLLESCHRSGVGTGEAYGFDLGCSCQSAKTAAFCLHSAMPDSRVCILCAFANTSLNSEIVTTVGPIE